MSRTIKKKKHPCFEYWSKRPGPSNPGKKNKKITHSTERARKRSAIDILLKNDTECDFIEDHNL